MKFEFGLAFVMLLVVLSTFLGYIGLFPQFRFVSTRYGPGFSEAAFGRIKDGDSLDAVVGALGRPLKGQTNETEGIIWWWYAEPGWTIWYESRMIGFTNRAVFNKSRGLAEEW